MDNFTRSDALEAIPVAVGIIEEHPLENGGLRLSVAVPTRPLQQKLLRLPPTTRKDFELDAFGVQIIRWCDGKNSVRDILGLFCGHQRLDPSEAEKAVLTFLRTLVSKHIVVLEVAPKQES